jgi:hypothetical protein
VAGQLERLKPRTSNASLQRPLPEMATIPLLPLPCVVSLLSEHHRKLKPYHEMIGLTIFSASNSYLKVI